MKSKLTIDFKGLDTDDGANRFTPVIRANVEDSDDVRDGLMRTFFHELGGQSNWLNVDIWNNGDSKQSITISAISPSQILDTAEIMINRIPQEDRAYWLNEQLKKSLIGLPVGFLENNQDTK